MSDLSRALIDLQAIRRQVVCSTEFRGYGPATLATTAAVAVVTGAVQRWLVPDASFAPGLYLAVWLSCAVVCVALIATLMLVRSRRLHAGMADEMMRHAVLQFLPMGLTGAALPVLLWLSFPAGLWLMPGLWQVLCGLGIFASRQSMPRAMPLAGAWFLLSGFAVVWLGAGVALQPWAMAGPFAAGMTLVAAIQALSTRKEEA